MRWEMDMDEIEAVLETIWDLHDKISDAIHSISRSHFLKSIKALAKPSSLDKKMDHFDPIFGENDHDEKAGFVFIKDFSRVDDDDGAAAMAEARSLNAIRTALENLEDQLEFFHTIQCQQRAERDAALARLEQSRIILEMRLANHQGRKCKVIEEALAFVGNVHHTCCLASPGKSMFEVPGCQSRETLDANNVKRSGSLMRMLMSSFTFAKSSLKMENLGGVWGNAALFAVSILALLQLHGVAFKAPQLDLDRNFYSKRSERSIAGRDGLSHFDVFSARG